MSQISKSDKMTWVRHLCSSEANYKSQVRPKLWDNFWGVQTPTVWQWWSGNQL